MLPSWLDLMATWLLGCHSLPPTLGSLPACSGRYHDGHTRCDGAEAATLCRGFVEATYTYASSARYFLTEQLSTSSPYVNGDAYCLRLSLSPTGCPISPISPINWLPR